MRSLVRRWTLDEAEARPVARALARIDAVDDVLHAWLWVDRGDDRGVDRGADGGPGPLAGVPFAVKDVIDLAGVPTRCGSGARADAPPAAADADVVTRLRALGAVPVGKTVTTEFAAFEPGPTRNPHDPTRTPGGSSSGSAAAVAAGTVPLALGTQTAGSTVRPAAYCGIAGYATPRAVLATTGIAPLAPSLDTVGFFAADVAGLARVRAALDGRDPLAVEPPGRLWCWDGGGAADPGMVAALADAAGRARGEGVDVTGLRGVDTAHLAVDHRTVLAHEAARALPEPHLLAPGTAALVVEGRAVGDAAYRAALARGAVARERVLALLADRPAILAPAAVGVAPEASTGTGDPAMSTPWHLLGLPALAVPGLCDAAGLPLGLALLGHPEREHELLACGRWLESLLTPAPDAAGLPHDGEAG